jgi:NADH-quinone oxidoreductase subunit H
MLATIGNDITELLKALWAAICSPDQALVILKAAVVGLFPESCQSWVSHILSILPIIAVFPGLFALITWAERKILGRIQNRFGPNRVGPYGLFQPVADGLKMLSKEDIVPRAADQLLHFLAPILLVVPALLVYSVLPMGRNMTPADIDAGVIAFFAIGAISEIAVFIAGWASRNKYSILGALRGVAQMVSYEIPLVLSAVTVVMVVGSLNTSEIVNAQNGGRWFVFTPWGFAGFILFFIASVAEVNRSPFDIPEAESEIIAGYHTEYSGFKFAVFFLAEYLAAIALSGLGVTLFLGGWQAPGLEWLANLLPSWLSWVAGLLLLGDAIFELIPSYLWFLIKALSLIFVMIWLRGTLPRLRSDQLMGFAWKFMLPMSLVNILAAGIWFKMVQIDGTFGQGVFAWFCCAMILFLAYFGLSTFCFRQVVRKREYRDSEGNLIATA